MAGRDGTRKMNHRQITVRKQMAATTYRYGSFRLLLFATLGSPESSSAPLPPTSIMPRPLLALQFHIPTERL